MKQGRLWIYARVGGDRPTVLDWSNRMFKLAKLMIKLVLVVVILLVVAVVGLVFYIDAAARSAVESAATRVMGVETKIGSMDVGIAKRSVTLGDLQVANPQGYNTPYFLKMEEGTVAIWLGTLMKDKVVVPQLSLQNVEMYLEKQAGKANYQVIMENLGLDKPVPPEEQKKFIINDLSLKNVTVHASLLPVGGALTSTKIVIPEIALKDVGSESDGGILLGDVSEVIVKAIMQAVADKGVELPGNVAAELDAGLNKLDDIQAKSMKVIDDASKTANQVGENLDKAGKSLDEAGKAIDKTAKELGNLFGGKKKDKDASEQK